jgi:2-oxoglutarate ferredoxin oxidoreductase subunit alpha
MQILADEGRSVNFLQCRLMRPFPAADVEAILRKAKRLVLVEENYSGQLGSLLAEQTGVRIADRVLKFDGRPFSEDEMVAALRSRLDGKAGSTTEVVMTHVR